MLERAQRLSRKSIDDYYNPYTHFDWTESLEDDQYWMPADLLSLYGTPYFETLGERQVKALSKWESISFYSLNVHGIREVLHEAVERVHTARFAPVSDYLHHFIGEENEHMWFFARFCTQYGGKIYPNRTPQLETDLPQATTDFLVFARTVIFEEIVDFFNVRIGQDASLHPLIQHINRTHHKDESRHVAFGREIVRDLYARLLAEQGSEGAAMVDGYLKRYLGHCIDLFYQAPVYRDAGLPDPFKLRNMARNSQERVAYHERMLARTVQFLVSEGILSPGGVQ
ncbi:MAG TPA: diiron oxygenase [Arenibaculum sp.]|nr:diiron oxygenase [Arenibaculum sp.]